MRFDTLFAAAAAFATAAIAAPPPPRGPPRPGPGRPGQSSTLPAASTTSTAEIPACTSVSDNTSTSTVTATSTSTVTASSTSTSTSSTPTACVSDADADDLAEVFRLLIQEYSDELALTALTEDFVDYASSVNILMNGGAEGPKNITGPTFASRAEFMSGQGSQPQIPFERLNTFHGCDSVSVRWMTTRSANGQPTEVADIPVVGNGIMSVVPAEAGNKYNFRIKTLYSEFNAAAWLVNLGVFTPAGPVSPVGVPLNVTTKRSIGHSANFRGPMI